MQPASQRSSPARLVVEGACDPRFAPVQEAFEIGFADQEQGGGAVSVWLDGRHVVDLRGGSRRIAVPDPWRPDTLACIHSATKPLSAACVLLLVERGQIELDRPVAAYWPEFAAAGKQDITVRMLLGGLAALIYPDAAPAGSFFDHDAMARALEQQEPAWPPGTRGAYHGSTFPCLVDELVRRVSGRPLGGLFRDEIAAPLGIDAHIGVADHDLDRIPEIHAPLTPAMQAMVSDPKLVRAWAPMPSDHDVLNSRACRQSGNAGAGYVTAAALATFYGLLAAGGSWDGVRLLDRDAVQAMRKPQWSGVCGLTDRPLRMALGIFLNAEAMPMGANPDAFGHHGLGGSLGFADPDAGLGFGYVTNSLDGEQRCLMLVDSLASCV